MVFLNTVEYQTLLHCTVVLPSYQISISSGQMQNKDWLQSNVVFFFAIAESAYYSMNFNLANNTFCHSWGWNFYSPLHSLPYPARLS